jgi:hypothetical protein
LKKYQGVCEIIVAETDTEAREIPIVPHSPLFIKERFMKEIRKTSR